MQLSRPYMIALGAVVALVAAWMLVIRPHSQGSSSSSGSQSAASAPGPAAPGVNGLAHAVAKAHGAVALSQQNAAQLAAKSAAASSSQGTAATGGTASSPAAAASHATPVFHPAAQPKPSAAPSTHAAPASRAAEVTGPLAQGKVVVILFWDPRGADDQAVMHQLADVSRRNGKVVVLQATPGEVASFGSVTRGIQIMETPTTLVIDHSSRANVLTGLIDDATIEQAVVDAQRGAGAVQTPTLTAWTSHSRYMARANGTCRALIRAQGSSGTLAQQIGHFHQLALNAMAQIAAVRAIPEPPADQVTLGRWFGMLDRAVSEIDGAVSAAAARHYTTARTLLFNSQADWDRGSQGLANYGLTACFPQASVTS